MRTALYVLLALAVPAFAGQTVYKWVDEKGVTHFSDQPVAGAEKVELSGGPKRSSDADSDRSYSTPRQDPPVQKGPAYSRFVVESPQQDESIVNTGGAVRVRLASTPAISGGDVVVLYLDGSPVADFEGMSHDFSNMPRGTHTLKAIVSSPQGKMLQETPAVTFHVRQESIAKPPVGPAMRNNNAPRRTSGNKLRTEQPSYSALNGGKAQMDPRTNMPINPKPAPAPSGPKAGK